ncbi:hypothetical protein Stube_26670 [Streptomyces tubercidicus]|uniref:Uncharacterized protein n=2 Tax=Streptomyces tubercidicus TaxID=47759 RepID=A0A640URH5_9ACTN|nr:hypothetical protein Stube_26670 [Streptomyces tubercidicus]
MPVLLHHSDSSTDKSVLILTPSEMLQYAIQFERIADGDSETLTLLRARMHHDYERRQRYGPLGRSL